jgi:sedoheptulokinase
MDLFVGLDIGTSKISAVALDARGALASCASRSNDAAVGGLAPGRDEQSPKKILEICLGVLHDLSQKLGVAAASVRAMGLTGQMHGGLLADENLQPLTNLVTWRDRRAEEPAEEGRSFLTEFLDRAALEELAATGMMPSAGYLGTTLYWFVRSGSLAPKSHWALTIHDWVASRMAGALTVATDPSDAASTGLFDVQTGRWSAKLIEAAGVCATLMPRVQEPGTILGRLDERIASAVAIPPACSIHNALGDNQASVLASLRSPLEEVLVNIGTGGQTSAVTPRFLRAKGIEVRPFPGAKFLAVGASLCGGAAFRYLAEHYAVAIRELTGTEIPLENVMTVLSRLAEAAPAGAAGLIVEPLFLGRRDDPARRGAVCGMSMANNTPAHWARAFIEAMARELADYYRTMRQNGLSERTRLVGSGNGVRLNPLTRAVAAAEFGLPLSIPAWREEAACGAALSAMVGTGALESFDAARELVRYET